MIKYYRLFDLLNRNGMKKTDLLEIISSPTLAKLGKGEIVKTDIIDKICLYLECQPEDIMECIHNEETINEFKIGDIAVNKDIMIERKVINKYGESENLVEIKRENFMKSDEED